MAARTVSPLIPCAIKHLGASTLPEPLCSRLPFLAAAGVPIATTTGPTASWWPFLMTARAMAKVGQMVLQHGVWNGDTLFYPKLIERVLATLGPFDRSGSVVQSPRVVDSAAAYPPTNAAWREIVSVPNPTNNGALTRIAVDTGAPQHLDDGSYLVWLRTTHERPLSRAGQPYNWQTSRFLLRCETPTDGRHKGVSITGFMNDDPVFQRVVGLATATTQPWAPAWGGSFELIIFRRACSALTAS